jgi:hypothetical protein
MSFVVAVGTGFERLRSVNQDQACGLKFEVEIKFLKIDSDCALWMRGVATQKRLTTNGAQKTLNGIEVKDVLFAKRENKGGGGGGAVFKKMLTKRAKRVKFPSW